MSRMVGILNDFAFAVVYVQYIIGLHHWLSWTPLLLKAVYLTFSWLRSIVRWDLILFLLDYFFLRFDLL